MNVDIDQIMRHPVMTGTPHQTRGHVRQLMAEHRVSALPIVDSDGAPVGIVTAADLLHDLPDGAPVSSFMTSPVLTVPRYEKPHIAARIMRATTAFVAFSFWTSSDLENTSKAYLPKCG